MHPEKLAPLLLLVVKLLKGSKSPQMEEGGLHSVCCSRQVPSMAAVSVTTL
jgi:hypothetical protein